MHANLRRLLVAAVLIAAAPLAFANVITDWDEKAVAVVTPMARLDSTNPYMAQRMMGMVHAAIFDAVNSIEQRYRPYLVQLPADSSTSKEAAAAAAAAAVLATIDAKTAGEMKVALGAYLEPRQRSEIGWRQARRGHRGPGVGGSCERRLQCTRRLPAEDDAGCMWIARALLACEPQLITSWERRNLAHKP